MEVHAAGVNLLDAKIRSGEFKLILRYGMPLILGHDVAGVVVKVGPRAQPFKVGDEVYARVDDLRIGTFAELVPVKASSLALKPASLTMAEAASVPLVGLTAWQALVEMAALKRGQSAFIQAGSGGVGTFAIQLAKQRGARVATHHQHGATWTWSGAWAQTPSSTTGRRTSWMCCATRMWCSTARTARP